MWTDKKGVEYFETEEEKTKAYAIVRNSVSIITALIAILKVYEERNREVDNKKVKPCPKEHNSEKMKVIDKTDKTKVVSIKHYDQNESNGNAAKKYIIEFTSKVNCDWLWRVLDNALRSGAKEHY